MFHFSEKIIDIDSVEKRLDVCSGYFKHIQPELIDKVSVVILNQYDLVLQVMYENWHIPFASRRDGESPKQAIIREVLEKTGVKLVPKSLEQLCFDKIYHQVEGELDSKGNQLWKIERVQVVFVCQLKDDVVMSTESSKWIDLSELEKLSEHNRREQILVSLIRSVLI
jgi:ADP-ribose pyrophosphatase YjhB (NUDIX family)